MAADYVVGLPCAVKRELGEGDVTTGTAVLVDRLKSASRAAATRAMAVQRGENPDEVKVSIRLRNADGTTSERPVTLDELERQGTGLVELQHHCAACPANALEQPFGCSGGLRYPVPQVVEQWVMSRLQPAGSIGGHFLTSALRDFQITGGTAAGARRSGMFESENPVTLTYEKKLFRSTKISSDQIFEAILFVGTLDPSHCLGLLLWLGAIEFDGRPIVTLEEGPRLNVMKDLPTEQRVQRTKLAPEKFDQVSPLAGIRDLLAALLKSWQNEVPLFMDA